MADAIKKAKMTGRNGKAALTRIGKTMAIQVAGNRPAEEVKKALEKCERGFSDLVTKHKEFTMLLEDDSEFETKEAWMKIIKKLSLS